MNSPTPPEAPELHPGRWWRKEGARFVCELCPRLCHLSPGQRGFCFVRMATPDGIALTTYGRSSGFCIDPIEKKPLNHFLPGTPILSFGTAGCNLGCRFCQNWEISKAKEMDALMDSASPQDIVRAARRTDCRAVAFTYNDPVIFAEYAIDTAKAAQEAGIATVAVTAGYITPQARPEFYAVMDAANVDLKAFTERFYKQLCYGHLEPVKETLQYLVHETSVWTEITTLLIPEENDSDEELHALSAWVREALGPEVPLHFTAYHPDFRLKRPPTPAAALRRARHIGQEEGLHYVYTGNLPDPQGSATRCPGCGTLLVARDGYDITHWGMSTEHPGHCAGCDREIPGRFEARPGHWGSRRQPLRLAEHR